MRLEMLLELLIVGIRFGTVEVGAFVRERSRKAGMNREAMSPEVLGPVERFGAFVALITTKETSITGQLAA